ncbi:hypothetical protein GCM10010266_27440 [Streptomyces griseomycini]|uniref:DNA-binding LacI/PurR family transcriptional regulator n=2 Tax=Streptomyces griseomycini TaxID=66895 RepID=A0A7W7LZQ7_9ACTN|nr:DNA-binding LacI/PurR family transcriptional regulator [Streptomyces griseomycini]GGQ02602.1 hypothetical protein GCM10010266_27440 [Streptomyces griseomycini]GGR19985.1 hypothetical protein GCM10015536_27160 [Streptomyces griseomycini]
MSTMPVGGLTPRATDDAADLVVRNAGIHTGGPRLPRAEAIAVRDGVITAVGGDEDVAGQVGPATRVVDALGRRRIAHITGPRDRTSATDRLHGYRDVLADADPLLPCEGDVAEEGGARAMGALLDRHPGTGAVFASNDTVALRTLRERGVRVPQDVAVVGLDDTASVVRAAEPPLTTVRQDIEGTGRIAVKLLMRLPDAPGEEVPAPVITRTTPVRRAAA